MERGDNEKSGGKLEPVRRNRIHEVQLKTSSVSDCFEVCVLKVLMMGYSAGEARAFPLI